MNPLYEAYGKAPVSPMQYLSQLKMNPTAFVRQAGYSIPDGMTSPQQMINYLIQSGQVSQSRLAQAQSKASQYRF